MKEKKQKSRFVGTASQQSIPTANFSIVNQVSLKPILYYYMFASFALTLCRINLILEARNRYMPQNSFLISLFKTLWIFFS